MKSLSRVQLLPDPMACSLPGSSVHGIFQARVLEWGAIAFSINYTKAFDCVDHNKLWKIFKEMGIPVYLICLLRNCMRVKEKQLEPDMEQWTGSKLGKEYAKAVYCHPAYLTSMQSTS